MTLAEVKDAFDLPINATAMGYYVNDPTALAKEPAAFRAYIESESFLWHCAALASGTLFV